MTLMRAEPSFRAENFDCVKDTLRRCTLVDTRAQYMLSSSTNQSVRAPKAVEFAELPKFSCAGE